MAALIQVEDLPATDRVEILRDHMLHAPVPLELRPAHGLDLHARSSVATFGPVQLLSTLGSGATVVRTERLARDDTEPHVVVTVLGGGQSSVFQRDRLARLRPGAVVVHDTWEPYWATFETNTLRHSFQIPVSQLRLPEGLVASVSASPLDAEPVLAAVVSSHLTRLAHSAAALTPGARTALAQPTLDLVRSLLAVHTGQTDVARAGLAGSLRTRIFEFVHLHLTDPELGAPMIAAALGVSERYVYAVMRGSGISLGDWIRQLRIDAAAALLAGSQTPRPTISDVAHRYAFADHAHFTRTFRAVRGMTPSQWRRAAQDSDRA